MVVVYGRRGVGKSALLAEALRGSRHFFYQASTRMLPQQLEDLTEAVRAFATQDFVVGVLPSIDSALDAIAQIAARMAPEPAVVVFDELPYLALAEPAISSVLQRWWDRVRQQGPANLKVFLLGSLMSWMEEQTLSVRGPLHNRRTGQIRVEPLGYADSALFYPGYEPVDRVAAYAVWGGMPTYLSEIDPQSDLWSNVRESILVRSGRLAEEPVWLRFADLRSDAVYESILRAVATGSRRPGKIAVAIGRDKADEVMYHLDRLCDLHLLERVVPIHERRTVRSKNSLYRLADHYVAFWYRFVDRLRHLLAMGLYDQAVEAIRRSFDHYVSEQAFEDLCRQYLWRAYATGRLPPDLTFDDIGAWWKSQNGDMDQIDLVATKDDKAVLVGECKWSSQPCGSRELEGLRAALRRAAEDLAPVDRPWRALFSRSGFTSDIVALAADPAERLLLASPAELYASDGAPNRAGG